MVAVLEIDAPQPPQSTISNAQQGGTASVGFGRGMMSMDQVAQNMERFGQQMQGVGRFQGFGGLIGRLIDSIGQTPNDGNTGSTDTTGGKGGTNGGVGSTGAGGGAGGIGGAQDTASITP